MSTEDVKPGAQEYYAMHGGSDAWRSYVMYGEWDDTNETGTPVDLTGVTIAAHFFDENGGLVFTATVDITDAVNGEFTIKPGRANTSANENTSFVDGMEWSLQCDWTDGSRSIEMYGGWEIGKDLTQ